MSGIDIRQLKELQKKLEKAAAQADEFCNTCTKELSQSVLRGAIKGTPVGKSIFQEELQREENGTIKVYKRGSRKGQPKVKRVQRHLGGTLRRGWTVQAETAGVGQYKATVFNSVEYAPYVEYGHRQTPGRYVPAIGKRLVKAWVPGQHMLLKAVNATQNAAPAILEREMRKFFEETFQNE